MNFSFPNFRKILYFIKPYRSTFLLGVVFTFLFTVFNGFTFGAIIPVVDTLTPGEKKFNFEISAEDRRILSKGSDLSINERFKKKMVELKVGINSFLNKLSKKEQLLYISLAIIPLFFFRSLFSILAIYTMRRTGLLAVRDIQTELFSHLQKLSLEFFYGERTGHLMQRLTQDMTHLNEVISKQLELLIRHGLTVLIFLAAIIYVSWEMSLFAFIVLPVMVTPIAAFTNRLHRVSRKLLSKSSDLTAYLQEALSGVRVIRSFGKEKFEISRFFKLADNSAWTELKKHLYAALGPSMVEFFSSIASASLFYFGGLMILSNDISTGEFIFFLLALLSLLTPIQQMSRMSAQFHQADAVAERTLEILNRKPKITDPENAVSLDLIKEGIEFKDVYFRYEKSEHDVLKGVNLKIPQGQTIALVGTSGGGKSTIMDMTARFYDPLQGDIQLDGVSLRNISLPWYRSKIAIVTQEIFLFSDTIRFNIMYGKDDATEEELIQAAKAANAHEFISKLPQGYDTVIGERGVTLSGGQRQRISIARAILCNPDILLLDEATSALDTESEKLVQDAINHLLQGRTSLVIAHRLSTIQGADRIIVVENGEVTESGDHNELLALNGSYKRLYDMQFDI